MVPHIGHKRDSRLSYATETATDYQEQMGFEAADRGEMSRLRKGRALLWLGALAPIIYATPRTSETATGITAIDIVRGGGPIACFVWVLLHPYFKRYRLARTPVEWALFGFVLVALASALWAQHSP